MYYQVSGKPLLAMSTIGCSTTAGVPLLMLEQLGQNTSRQDGNGTSIAHNPHPNNTVAKTTQKHREKTLHKPNIIVFVRRRMLYARPNLNGKGEVRFGLRHIRMPTIHASGGHANLSIDVLNRFPSDSLPHTVHVMKYIFPRQFRLHNVFTSKPDFRQTVQPLKDYTMREDEISQSAQRDANGGLEESIKIPKRLRGKTVELVRKLQKRNKNCPYVELLRYYCPSEVSEPCSFLYARADIVAWSVEARPRWLPD